MNRAGIDVASMICCYYYYRTDLPTPCTGTYISILALFPHDESEWTGAARRRERICKSFYDEIHVGISRKFTASAKPSALLADSS